jgi:hypothetical protein
MSWLGYTILLSSILLNVCLLWRLVRATLWRRLSLLFSYLVYSLVVMDLAQYATFRVFPHLYASLYWNCETVSLVLRFLVVWELYRETFFRESSRRHFSSQRLSMLAFAAVLVALSGFSGFAGYRNFHSLYPSLESGIGFAQATLVLTLLLGARHYGIRLGRNVWGIAVGLGAYTSIVTAQFALYHLNRSLFLPYWQVLVPLSFNAMLAMWTWALWNESPRPRVEMTFDEQRAGDLLWWSDRWEKTLTAVRKVIHS